MRLSNVLRALRDEGVANVAHRVRRASFPRRELRQLGVLTLVEHRTGLEIGGPSPAFGRLGAFPAYRVAARIDNCIFAASTVWEGDVSQGRTFRFNPDRAAGEQFVAEATGLGFAECGTYDFVLSSHAIEHCANPLAALGEWKRVLKPGGLLALIVPHRHATFDHRRPVSTLDHLIEDFENQVDESDLTHLGEILELHDLGRDPGAGGADAFRARAMRNHDNRCLHHHVFDTKLAHAMVDHAGFSVLNARRPTPMDIVVLATKPKA